MTGGCCEGVRDNEEGFRPFYKTTSGFSPVDSCSAPIAEKVLPPVPVEIPVAVHRQIPLRILLVESWKIPWTENNSAKGKDGQLRRSERDMDSPEHESHSSLDKRLFRSPGQTLACSGERKSRLRWNED